MSGNVIVITTGVSQGSIQYPAGTDQLIVGNTSVTITGSASINTNLQVSGNTTLTNALSITSGGTGASTAAAALAALGAYPASNPAGYTAATGFASSGYTGTNGWQKLSSGLIIQWGLLDNTTSPTNFPVIYWPMAFPSVCVNVTFSPATTSGAISLNRGGPTTTNFPIYANASGNWYWHAIGW